MSADSAPPGPTELPHAQRINLLLLSFSSLFAIGFGVWLVSAGKRYREQYAQFTEGWRVGSTQPVELTLVREDKRNLACASDQSIEELHCGYRRDQQEAGPPSPDDPHILQPFNTVGNELLLGAGLWSSSDLKEPLPQRRFTVSCNYHVKGVMKAVSIRFAPTAAFGPAGKSVTVGTLTDCTLPR